MAIEDLIHTRPGEDSLAHSRLDQPIQYWGPPLAAAQTHFSDDAFADDDLIADEEHPSAAETRAPHWNATNSKSFAEIARRLQPHHILIASSFGLATLGLAALASMWSSADEKTAALSEQPGRAVQSPQAATQPPGQRASGVAVSAADPSVAVAWPDLPSSLTAEPAAVGTTAAPGKSALQENAAPEQKEDIVFLQRPGVHIRSAPSTNGRIVATAPKGTRFKITSREGDWVQVESDRFSGWIRGRFVAANEP